MPCSATPWMQTAVWSTTCRDHFGVSSKLGSEGERRRANKEKSHVNFFLFQPKIPPFICYSKKTKLSAGRPRQALMHCSLHLHLLGEGSPCPHLNPQAFFLVCPSEEREVREECCGTYLAAHQLLNHQHKRTKTTLEAGLTTSQRRIVWFKTHMPPNNTLLQHLLATTHEEGEKGRQGTEEINQNVTGQPDSTTSNIALIQEAATKLFCPLGSCLIEN